MSTTPLNTIRDTGASPNSVLLGVTERNRGLLLKIAEQQPQGQGGRIVGPFRVLDAGTGTYASGIANACAAGDEFRDAGDFIESVSRLDGCGDCTHIVNANGLWELDAEMLSRWTASQSYAAGGK